MAFGDTGITGAPKIPSVGSILQGRIMRRVHREIHLVERIGWLRAAVLGANDGIISTASLILGVASAAAARSDVLLAGVAGLVAGAMSMAAGEYVSVSSQSDTEQADLARERRELANDPEFEKELAQIYVAPAATRSITAQPSSLPLGGPRHRSRKLSCW
jgi:VIT1/CCC1 family predicted Fe2+/Mn2+ transporter